MVVCLVIHSKICWWRYFFIFCLGKTYFNFGSAGMYLVWPALSLGKRVSTSFVTLIFQFSSFAHYSCSESVKQQLIESITVRWMEWYALNLWSCYAHSFSHCLIERCLNWSSFLVFVWSIFWKRIASFWRTSARFSMLPYLVQKHYTCISWKIATA